MGTIKWKLVLLYVILVVFVIIVSGIYIIINVQKNAYETTYTELEYTSDRIIDTLQTAGIGEDVTVENIFAEVISALMMESVNMDTKSIYLLDGDGNTVYYRDVELTAADLASRTIIDATEGRVQDELYVHKVNQENSSVVVGDYAMHFTVKGDEEEPFILFIRQTMTEVESTINNTVVIIIAASLIAILIAGVLAFFLAGTISTPIQKLTQKTQELAKGNLAAAEESLLPKGARDELSELESNFTYMARALSSMLREVNHEKNKLATIFSYMADGLAVYDTDGCVIQCNPAAVRMMGDRIAYEDFHRMFAPYRIQDLLAQPGETHSKGFQAGETYVNAVFAAYTDEEQTSAGLIVVLQDTTEQKQMEEMQKEFVANVSHELRTPITTIKSYVETLLDGGVTDQELEERFLGVINHESDRMTYLITELLDLSRIDSRQVKMKLELIDLTTVVEDSQMRHRILAMKKEQTMIFDGVHTPLFIMADQARIEQVLRNLITNAVKYSPERTAIHLGLEPDLKAGTVSVYVRDNGVGIEKKEQERIFERFYRVDKARSRSMGGTGLGLAIAREIMELHHGSIRVESEYGKGSTFWLVFPLQEPPREI